MKIYSIIVTIIAVLALSIVGYGYFKGLKIKKTLVEYQARISSLEEQIQKSQSNAEQKSAEITNLTEILRESSGSFVHAGDIQVSSFNQTSLDKISQGIKEIENEAFQKTIEDKWDAFCQSRTLNDYRDFLGTMADTIRTEIKGLQFRE